MTATAAAYVAGPDALGLLEAVQSALQVVIGLAILIAAHLLSATSVDRETKKVVRWPLAGMGAWAAWFAAAPFAGRPDSPPALAFAGLVAYVLIAHRRLIVRWLLEQRHAR